MGGPVLWHSQLQPQQPLEPVKPSLQAIQRSTDARGVRATSPTHQHDLLEDLGRGQPELDGGVIVLLHVGVVRALISV